MTGDTPEPLVAIVKYDNIFLSNAAKWANLPYKLFLKCVWIERATSFIVLLTLNEYFYIYFGLIYGLWLRVIVAFEARILFKKLVWRAGQLLHVGHWKLRESAWQERMVRSQQNFNNKISRNGKNTKKHSLFWQCLFSPPFCAVDLNRNNISSLTGSLFLNCRC